MIRGAMDALLGNIPKPNIPISDRRQEMGVSLGVDLSGLDVCFGGFSPTLMGDITQALDKAEESEERLRQRKLVLDHARAIEAARASAPREGLDANGTRWRYVILDGVEVQIIGCHPACDHLIVPAALEGLPVVALADDACAHLSTIVSVQVPNSVLSIGYCAFRNCTALRRAVLPREVPTYDSGWFRNCNALEELELPGQLDRLMPNVFDAPNIRRLRIGAGTKDIYPGTFSRGHLRTIEVDPTNPYLETDGVAVYAKGRTRLMAAAVRTSAYTVAAECTAIGRKAFDGMTELRDVVLSDGITAIGEHAFAHTSLRSFAAPQRLRTILERAFFDCASLCEVHLNAGLIGVGEHAFTRTAIDRLVLPSSTEWIGHPVAADTLIRYAGEDATLVVEEGGSLHIDDQGALLRECADGLHLEWMVDPEARELRVPDGVVSVDARALLNHKGIETVELPDSVIQIEEAAFKGCCNLRRVRLGCGLQRIGAEAFLDAELEALSLPAHLEHIGIMALVTQGAHSGRAPTSLRQIHVDAGNERFCVEDGLLLETVAPGQRRVVHYLDEQSNVRIPADATSVAPYAFSGARNLRSLHMSSALADIGIRALAVDRLVETVRIEMEEPLEGHDAFEIRFPDTDRGQHQQFVAFTTQAAVSVQGLLEHYDNAIANASSFDAVLGGGALDLYEQVVRIMERLRDPVFLTDVNRQILERVVRQHLDDVCVAVARRDDRAAVDALVELGFVHEDNIDRLIEQVGRVQDAAMTGYLLEVRRRAFGHVSLDFTL